MTSDETIKAAEIAAAETRRRAANAAKDWKGVCDVYQRSHQLYGDEGVLKAADSDAQILADAWLTRSPDSVSQWQPIESAPQDGRTILLGCFNKLGKWRTMRGQWMSENYIAEYWEEPDDGEPGWFETTVECDDLPNCWPIEPTRWMPLPAPPQEEATANDTR